MAKQKMQKRRLDQVNKIVGRLLWKNWCDFIIFCTSLSQTWHSVRNDRLFKRPSYNTRLQNGGKCHQNCRIAAGMCVCSFRGQESLLHYISVFIIQSIWSSRTWLFTILLSIIMRIYWGRLYYNIHAVCPTMSYE